MARFWRREAKTAAPALAAPQRQAPARVRTPLRDTDWQTRVRRYDEEGPGVVGQYLDVRAFIASQAATVVQVNTLSGWKTLEATQSATPEEKLLLGLVQRIFLSYANRDQDFAELVFDHARALSGVAECAIGTVPGYGRIVAQAPEMKGTAGAWTWRSPEDEWLPLLAPIRSHTYNRAKANRKEPYSPLRRALPDIERIVMSAHGQLRPLASRIVSNGIIRVPFPRDPDASDDLLYDFLDAADSDVIDLRYMGSAIKDSRRLVPHMYEGDESLEWIDVGRNLDPGLLQLEEKALESFARSVAMPLKLILDGPGNAKYSNEDALMAAFLRHDVAPLIAQVYRAINKSYLRPRLAELVKAARTTYASNDGFMWATLRALDVESVALAGDVEPMLVTENRAEFALEAYKMGITTRGSVARAIGVDVLDIPDGMSDYNHWQLINGAWTGDGKPGNNLRPDGSITDVADVSPIPSRVEKPAPERTASIALPPARMTNRPADVVALEARLAAADSTAAEAILDWMEAMADAAANRLAAAAMRSLAKNDERRVELRGQEPDVIFTALADVVDWRVAAAEAVEEWDTAEMGRIITRASRQLGELGVPIPVQFDSAVRVAKAHAAKWMAKHPKSRRPRPPALAAVETLMAAAGANSSADGTILRTPDGIPMVDGIPWRGGTGFASSPPVVAALARDGFDIGFEWRTSFHGSAQSPHDPHMAMAGVTAPSGDPAFWSDHRPHEHSAHCHCALTLRLALREQVTA